MIAFLVQGCPSVWKTGDLKDHSGIKTWAPSNCNKEVEIGN